MASNQTLFDQTPTFFGLALSTHRLLVSNNNRTLATDDGLDPEETAVNFMFPHQALIAAIAIAFFRWTVRLQKNEPATLRWFFCGLLAILAYSQKSYELIMAVEIFSYAVAWLIPSPRSMTTSDQPATISPMRQNLTRLLSIITGAVLSMLISHVALTSNAFWTVVHLATPSVVIRTLGYLFPIAEMKAAYYIMEQLSLERAFYHHMIQHLFFVTVHIQVGMGFLGIGFLRAEQSRRNELIRLDVQESNADHSSAASTPSNQNGTTNSSSMDDKSNEGTTKLLEKSRIFQRGAAPFIFGAALPYMAQIILYGNINRFAYVCVQDELHRTVRFRQVFEQDNHLTAMANDSPTSPEAYATSMNTVVSTAYEMFNRKLFSLPKVLLLPGVMSRQPLLVAQVFPFIILSDYLTAVAVSYMTKRIEELQKEIHDISAIRSKVESFDIKNAELLQRSGRGATKFTQRRWEELTIKVQARLIVSDLLTRAKGFFSFMQRNFVFTVLIDCALANLIAIGKIIPSEIFVFSRAIEDAIDMLLMRSRGEAELARMMTEVNKLNNLRGLWERSTKSNLLPCLIDETSNSNVLVLRNLHYSRGTASARADHLELNPGVYALTGSNGSGKSTLFRILMSCKSNEKSIDLHASINLLTPMEPLTEKDDVFRDHACLQSEVVDDDSIGRDQSCAVDSESDSGGKNRQLSATSTASEDVHVPRLSITMPSKYVVEISQTFYWPLYGKPIDWIYQDAVIATGKSVTQEEYVRRVAEELHSLQFFQPPRASLRRPDPDDDTDAVEADGETRADVSVSDATSSEATIRRIMHELLEEKEDWFSDLSGGQRSKAELVRTVFLRSKCPDVLLIDETMAPLDPASKELVMAKLKLFCSESIIIVIYHTDVGQGKEVEGTWVDCVPSNDFFDSNIHLDKGIVHIRPCCD